MLPSSKVHRTYLPTAVKYKGEASVWACGHAPRASPFFVVYRYYIYTGTALARSRALCFLSHDHALVVELLLQYVVYYHEYGIISTRTLHVYYVPCNLYDVCSIYYTIIMYKHRTIVRVRCSRAQSNVHARVD